MTSLEFYLLIVGSSLMGLFFALLISFYAIVFHYLRKLVHPVKRTFEELVEYEVQEKGFKREWLEIPFVAMNQKSKFGYELFGKFYKNSKQTNKTMISLHGHNSCSVSQMKYLEMFFAEGFNVFMPDHRYSGFSQGKSVTFGVFEKEDVISWLQLLSERFPKNEFYIFGESMGAATAMMVAAEYTQINAVIEYCGFANMLTLIKQHIKNEYLASKVFWPAMRMLCKLIYRFDLAKSNALESIKNIEAPVMIIHSKSDQVVGFENAMLLSQAKPEALFVTFEDTIHARSIVKYPEEFKRNIHDFLSGL